MEININNEGLPHVGERFQFTVVGGIGKTKIEVYVESRQIYAEECPDPPCHEMVQIPAGTAGAKLRIAAKDSVGNISERQFTIVGAERGAGGVMSAGA